LIDDAEELNEASVNMNFFVEPLGLYISLALRFSNITLLELGDVKVNLILPVLFVNPESVEYVYEVFDAINSSTSNSTKAIDPIFNDTE
jgi:hypothetical protein